MAMLRVAFQTLGCKLNQLETESIADKFLDAGAEIVPFHEEADLYIVNTCTVTSKAEQKARHDIRSAIHKVRNTTVIATGCYAQMDSEDLSLLDERVIVISGDLKASLLLLPQWLLANWQGHGELFHALLEWRDEILAAAKGSEALSNESGKTNTIDLSLCNRFAFHPERFLMHSRPALKIQDGCNNRCTYCRVCLARGPSVSLPVEDALSRVIDLERAGKTEVVLTGVNLAQYRAGGLDFAGILASMIKETSNIRFRISSYEPENIDEAFLATFAHPRVRPHLHLSVQSGCTETLRRMGRPYSAQDVRFAVQNLRSVRSDPFLAADIIAGFPAETESEFENTIALLSELDFAWIHAFPFSPRQGTRAADMRPRIPERIACERVDRLLELAKHGKRSYIERWLGHEVEMVIEHEASADKHNGDENRATDYASARIIGTTENYLKAMIEASERVEQSIMPGRAGDSVKVVLHSKSESALADGAIDVLATISSK